MYKQMLKSWTFQFAWNIKLGICKLQATAIDIDFKNPDTEITSIASQIVLATKIVKMVALIVRISYVKIQF